MTQATTGLRTSFATLIPGLVACLLSASAETPEGLALAVGDGNFVCARLVTPVRQAKFLRRRPRLPSYIALKFEKGLIRLAALIFNAFWTGVAKRPSGR